MPVNFFSPKSAAERYSRGRANFHPTIIERAKQFLSLREPLPVAVDVGCGTGLSSVALKEVARRIVGVDLSEAMLALALRDERISYVAASAERLPFGEDRFDLMTLSQVFHWLDRERFLGEARRVLRPGGLLIVYDNYFSGRMEERGDFADWLRESYWKRFPAPARADVAFEAADAESAGFELLGQEQFANSIRFSPAGLVDFLMSHSNVIAAVEFGGEDPDVVRRWLLESIVPLYGGLGEAVFAFNGVIWYLRRDE